MELLAIALMWPSLILVVGMVFISLTDVGASFSMLAGLFFLILVFGLRDKLGGEKRAANEAEQLEEVRRGVVAFSLALLLPIFVRYLLDLSEKSLSGMILCLILSFGMAIWGMFAKDNKVFMYGNVLGGLIAVVYLYSQLWSLGELPRIVGAAFGLAVAVVISVIKLRDRLT